MHTISVSLSAEQWNIVGLGLGEVPMKLAAPVFEEIKKQIDAATAAPPPAPPDVTS